MARQDAGIVHTIDLGKYGKSGQIDIPNPYNIDELGDISIMSPDISNIIVIDGKQYKDILPNLTEDVIAIIDTIITQDMRNVITGWMGENIDIIANKLIETLQIRNTEPRLISIASGIKGHPVISINLNPKYDDDSEKNAQAIINSFTNKTMLPGTLFLRSNRKGGGHQNAFVVDWNKNTIIRFEPLGQMSGIVGKFNNLSEKDIKDALKSHLTLEMLSITGIEIAIDNLGYYTTGGHGLCGDICGLFRKGVQKVGTGDKNCHLYSLYYLLLITINQGITNTDISKVNTEVHSQPYKKDLLYLLIYDLFKGEIDERIRPYETINTPVGDDFICLGKKRSKKQKRTKPKSSKKKKGNKKLTKNKRKKR